MTDCKGVIKVIIDTKEHLENGKNIWVDGSYTGEEFFKNEKYPMIVLAL